MMQQILLNMCAELSKLLGRIWDDAGWLSSEDENPLCSQSREAACLVQLVELLTACDSNGLGAGTITEGADFSAQEVLKRRCNRARQALKNRTVCSVMALDRRWIIQVKDLLAEKSASLAAINITGDATAIIRQFSSSRSASGISAQLSHISEDDSPSSRSSDESFQKLIQHTTDLIRLFFTEELNKRAGSTPRFSMSRGTPVVASTPPVSQMPSVLLEIFVNSNFFSLEDQRAFLVRLGRHAQQMLLNTKKPYPPEEAFHALRERVEALRTRSGQGPGRQSLSEGEKQDADSLVEKLMQLDEKLMAAEILMLPPKVARFALTRYLNELKRRSLISADSIFIWHLKVWISIGGGSLESLHEIFERLVYALKLDETRETSQDVRFEINRWRLFLLLSVAENKTQTFDLKTADLIYHLCLKLLSVQTMNVVGCTQLLDVLFNNNLGQESPAVAPRIKTVEAPLPRINVFTPLTVRSSKGSGGVTDKDKALLIKPTPRIVRSKIAPVVETRASAAPNGPEATPLYDDKMKLEFGVVLNNLLSLVQWMIKLEAKKSGTDLFCEPRLFGKIVHLLHDLVLREMLGQSISQTEPADVVKKPSSRLGSVGSETSLQSFSRFLYVLELSLLQKLDPALFNYDLDSVACEFFRLYIARCYNALVYTGDSSTPATLNCSNCRCEQTLVRLLRVEERFLKSLGRGGGSASSSSLSSSGSLHDGTELAGGVFYRKETQSPGVLLEQDRYPPAWKQASMFWEHLHSQVFMHLLERDLPIAPTDPAGPRLSVARGPGGGRLAYSSDSATKHQAPTSTITSVIGGPRH